MTTINGFVSLKGFEVPNPAESKRRRDVWVTKVLPSRLKVTILIAIWSMMMVWIVIGIASKKPEPILWVDGAEIVQQVELPDGTIIGNQDERVWEYIRHKPSYEIRFKSR
jgi:hypothetical protein